MVNQDVAAHRTHQSASPANSAEGIPFPDEIQHLSDVMRKLDAALADAEENVLWLDREYTQAKQYMVDYRSEMDGHEKLQNERLLAQTDRTGVFAVELREKVAKLKDSPYFARIDFAPDGSETASPYYIGRFGFTCGNENLIFDWRAPISGIFYDYDIGPAGFDAPVGRIEGELTRKRQFKIRNGVLEYAIESGQTVQDDILLKELAHTSDEKMKSIVSTIQREQNIVIRNEMAKTLLIQGVAGSGKTSIALHRIAFLLYRFKKQITAQDVTILSPNKVFADYISNVIPELGEEPIRELSISEIARSALKDTANFEPEKNTLEVQDENWRERVRFKSTLAFVRLLEDYVQNLADRVFKPKDYCCGGHTVSAEWIGQRFRFYGTLPVKKRLTFLAEDIRGNLRTQMSRWEDVPKAGVILKSLNKMLAVKSPLALYQDFYRAVNAPEMLVLPEKNTLEWDDVFPFLYLLAAYEGLGENRGVKHLVIDEMQDYTPVQYAVLNLMYPCRKTILGDFGQALNPCHLHTLEDMKTLYPDAEFVTLNKSYRATYEIMTYAKAVCDQPNLEMVERHGPVPQAVFCESEQEELRFLSKQIGLFQESGSASLGIVARTNADAKRLFDALSPKHQVHLLMQDSTQFWGGVSITSVQMAKGLEFDEVIVPDASARQYDSDDDRNLLYIACTRAMHKLTLSYTGKPSRFLPGP